MFYMLLSFSVVSLFVHLQIKPFRPDPGHFAAGSQSFRLSVQVFSRSALAWRARTKFLIGTRTSCRRPCLQLIVFSNYVVPKATGRMEWRQMSKAKLCGPFGPSNDVCRYRSFHCHYPCEMNSKIIEGERTTVLKRGRDLWSAALTRGLSVGSNLTCFFISHGN
jgi:hypothetical protein